MNFATHTPRSNAHVQIFPSHQLAGAFAHGQTLLVGIVIVLLISGMMGLPS
jgi:hypothetical protein